ncbi:uncharacterized protein LOC134772363 [Penaeus indicus]|uniref:uncharacterized protein LOC134772363 n=1 Tax=Penaeus indicus TaxID=29960 RepID=UPI00300D2510
MTPMLGCPKSVEKRGLSHQERVWPKRRTQKLKIGTINVGTMTGRGRALTGLMRRRKVDIMCVQETRWSGKKSKELGDGYKLIYGSVAEDERCVIGGDVNGHVGRGSDVISRVQGGMCYGEGYEDGEHVIDFTISNDMVISNTIFTKRQEHLITYKCGGRASQIDYLLYRRRNMDEIINCKVVPGDHVTNQHRLVVMDLNIKVSRVHSTPKPKSKLLVE